MKSTVAIGRSLADINDVRLILSGEAKLAPLDLLGTEFEKVVQELRHLADRVATEIVAGSRPISEVDAELAEALHRALYPVTQTAPEVLHISRFWEWLAFEAFANYGVVRWCGGDAWITDPAVAVPTGAARFIVRSGSVKSQSRHLVQRLYIYADCSARYGGDYSSLLGILGADLDIAGAVFERKLGLSPLMAHVLIRIASSIQKVPAKNGKPAKSARRVRRDFFRQVNLLVSTVAVECLGEQEMTHYFQEISDEIQMA